MATVERHGVKGAGKSVGVCVWWGGAAARQEGRVVRWQWVVRWEGVLNRGN